MTITIENKLTKEVNGIARCFIVVDGKEYKIPKRYFEMLTVGKTYRPLEEKDDPRYERYTLDKYEYRHYPLATYIK